MTLALSEVRDTDCIVFGEGGAVTFDDTARYVTGAAAVVRRVIYAIFNRRGRVTHDRGRGVDVRDLINAKLTERDIALWEQAIVREARATDFVQDAYASLARVGSAWRVSLALVLVDGGVYPLEVTIAEAGLAISNL